MKVYAGKDVRNVGIVGHGDCGKTTLASAMLYTTGGTNRLTSVDEGNTVTDHDEEEIGRRISISTALAVAEWRGTKLNLLDTPGYNIFINDTKAALIAADTALVVVDAVNGVEIQTEKPWGFASEYGIPKVIFVNKMHKERASVDAVIDQVKEAFGVPAVAVQIPLGREKGFRGVVDLISGSAYEYELGGKGKGRKVAVPGDMADQVEEARTSLIESVAETDEDLMDEYFEEGTLEQGKLVSGLKNAILDGEVTPLLCGSALHNMGIDLLLDFLVLATPAATDRGELRTESGAIAIDDDGPLALYVWKTSSDAFSGRLSYFRVASGVLHTDAPVYNQRKRSSEKFARISVARGKTLHPVPAIHAGDLGVVAKLKDTLTGDSLGTKEREILFPKAVLPAPSISYAIQPKSRQDEDRLGSTIAKVLEEDSSLNFYREAQTQQFLLAGTGQQHLDIVCSKLRKRYNVNVELLSPKIPYRETIRGSAAVHGRHKKQTGGHGQFGDCKIKVSPIERGEEFEFIDEIFGGSIPKTYIPAVEKGILEAAARGYLAGFPVVDFKVTLYDGSYHDVDSSELAFKLAGSKAFKLAMAAAKPALLEPIMKVEVEAPTEFAGDLMGDLNGRRGRIQGMDSKGSTQLIHADVPMAEMLTYANELTSITQGRGSFTMTQGYYDFVPGQIAEKIVEAARRERAGNGD
jgi:elongation factor G